jgi:predicted ATPase
VGKSGRYVSDILVADNSLLNRVNKQLERFSLDYELKLSSLFDQATAVQDVFALRLYEKSTGVHVGTTDVGFGFSQVLPVIVQCLLSKQNMILIEQPELHLHPRLQAEIGDLFIEAALGDSKNTLIIETHSEHLILRLLRRIRETAEGNLEEGQISITPDDLAVVYAKPTKDGTKLVHLRVTKDGDFVDPWPDGFFAERATELL